MSICLYVDLAYYSGSFHLYGRFILDSNDYRLIKTHHYKFNISRRSIIRFFVFWVICS